MVFKEDTRAPDIPHLVPFLLFSALRKCALRGSLDVEWVRSDTLGNICYQHNKFYVHAVIRHPELKMMMILPDMEEYC